jgi:hypothetical protein
MLHKLAAPAATTAAISMANIVVIVVAVIRVAVALILTAAAKTLFKPHSIVRMHYKPELGRAGVKVVQRVEKAVLNVNGKGCWPVGAVHVQI